MWTIDNDGHKIYDENLIPYPGYKNQDRLDKAGKAIQQEMAHGKAPCENVIIIGYSAGAESALMYAKWRLEQVPLQPVRAVVLLGPVFGSFNETGFPPLLIFGTTTADEIDNSGHIQNPNDWADYITILLMANASVYVFADDGTQEQAGAAQNYGNSYQNINGIKGSYYYDSQPNVSHTNPGGTKTEETYKKRIYDWINSH